MTDKEITNNKSSVSGPEISARDRPSQIGPYRILDTLGEGGMSVVYLAEQSEPVKRRVALKIIKPGMDSKQVLARFESERQALAVLDHPNIAKIFDGGIGESGLPYFVMEHVKGVPITDYCDDQRLSNKERLQIFIKVCSAVQHAHVKGLIHRDLKPSNIMVGVVDQEPQPKIIDFGIAKATTVGLTDSTLFTRVGQIIGTPQYMSPEQANITGLDVDTRADIYSLGVVLYELLVGTVPLDLRAIGDQAMQVALREKDPPRPSNRFTDLGDTRDQIAKVRRTIPDSLQRQLKGDLDWIVMHAIEKDRTRRYETANALAMECRRFLDHQPVLARPPSVAYHLQRFIRRNRLTVTAASIAIIAIITGAIGATLGYVRATEAELVAEQEAATARETAQFLVDLFQVSDPWSYTPVSGKSGTDITAREILDKGAERIRSELQGQPEVQSGLMVAIGRTLMGLGLPDQAKPLILDGLEVRRQTFPPDHIAIGDSLMAKGMLHLIYGEYEQAVTAMQEGISIYESAWGKDALGLAWMLSQLSVTLSNNGNHQEALEVQLRSLDILRTDPERNPFELGQALNNLGFVQNTLSMDKDSLVSFKEAVEVLSTTKARGLYSRALSNLAASYLSTGRLADSRELLEESWAIKREWFGADHNETAYTVNSLSFIYFELGDFEKAEELCRKTIEIFSGRLGDNHPNVGVVLGMLATIEGKQGKYAEAESTYFDALNRIRSSLGVDSLREVFIQSGIGELYAEQGRYSESETHYREALRIGMSINADDSDVAIARAGLAKLPVSALTSAEREQYFSEAIEQLRSNEGLNTPHAARILMDFSAFLIQNGNETRAQQMFEEGLVRLRAAIPIDNRRYLEQTARYEVLFGEPPPAP